MEKLKIFKRIAKRQKILYILLFALFLFSNSLSAQNQLNDSLQTVLLNEHNRYRKIVSSQELVWSQSLESSALQWANSLVAKPQIKKDESSSYGENVYWCEIGMPSENVVAFWASGQRYYYGENYKHSNPYLFKNYLQIISTEITEVGCVMVISKSKREVWICRYK